jgi:hypothetical protein
MRRMQKFIPCSKSTETVPSQSSCLTSSRVTSTRLGGEQRQNSKWLGLQEDAATVPAQLARGKVQFENAEPQQVDLAGLATQRIPPRRKPDPSSTGQFSTATDTHATRYLSLLQPLGCSWKAHGKLG